MNKSLLFRIILCIFFLGSCLYCYIDMQNSITDLRIRIPELTQSVRRIEEENTRLAYEIEAFESPENLMQLAHKNAFAKLKYPTNQEIITMKEVDVLKSELKTPKEKRSLSITFASGTP